MPTRIQVRRDTAANWTSVNPTLAAGEIGYESDTGKVKFGDGSTAWTSLAYLATGGGGGGGATVTIVDDFPVSPTEGDLIFHALFGKGYIYVGTTWVQITETQSKTGTLPAQASYSPPVSFGNLGSAVLDSLTDGGLNEVWVQTNRSTSSSTQYFPVFGYGHTYDERAWLGTVYQAGDGVAGDSLMQAFVVHDIGNSGGTVTTSDGTNTWLDTGTTGFTGGTLVWMNSISPSSDYPTLNTEKWISCGFRNITAVNALMSPARSFSTTPSQVEGRFFVRNGTRPVTDWYAQSWRITLDLCGMGGFPSSLSDGVFDYGVWFFPGAGEVDLSSLNGQGSYPLSSYGPLSGGIFFGLCAEANGLASSSTGAPYRAMIYQADPNAGFAALNSTGFADSRGWQGVIGFTTGPLWLIGGSLISGGGDTTGWTAWPSMDQTYDAGRRNMWRQKMVLEWDKTLKQLSISEYLLPGFYHPGAIGASEPAVTVLSGPNVEAMVKGFQEPLQQYRTYFYNSTLTTMNQAGATALRPILIERL